MEENKYANSSALSRVGGGGCPSGVRWRKESNQSLGILVNTFRVILEKDRKKDTENPFITCRSDSHRAGKRETNGGGYRSYKKRKKHAGWPPQLQLHIKYQQNVRTHPSASFLLNPLGYMKSLWGRRAEIIPHTETKNTLNHCLWSCFRLFSLIPMSSCVWDQAYGWWKSRKKRLTKDKLWVLKQKRLWRVLHTSQSSLQGKKCAKKRIEKEMFLLCKDRSLITESLL